MIYFKDIFSYFSLILISCLQFIQIMQTSSLTLPLNSSPCNSPGIAWWHLLVTECYAINNMLFLRRLYVLSQRNIKQWFAWIEPYENTQYAKFFVINLIMSDVFWYRLSSMVCLKKCALKKFFQHFFMHLSYENT